MLKLRKITIQVLSTICATIMLTSSAFATEKPNPHDEFTNNAVISDEENVATEEIITETEITSNKSEALYETISNSDEEEIIAIFTYDEETEQLQQVGSENEIASAIEWPNAVIIKLIKVSENKVRVSIQNVGLDWVDIVTCRLQMYNAYGLQLNIPIEEENIMQFFPRNNEYYLKNWLTAKVTDCYASDNGSGGNLPDVILDS